MDSLWPWLLLAGSGALHGLNPATGWIFAAVWAVRSGDRGRVRRTVLPLAAGHLAAIGIVGAAAAFAVPVDRAVLPLAAAGLLVAGAAAHRMPALAGIQAGHAGLALWSFMLATLHGAGLALAPTLVALCVSPGRGAGPALASAFGGVLVHTAGMLAVTALLAWAVSRRRWWLRWGPSALSPARSAAAPAGNAGADRNRRRSSGAPLRAGG